jgi:hypothetical protein
MNLTNLHSGPWLWGTGAPQPIQTQADLDANMNTITIEWIDMVRIIRDDPQLYPKERVFYCNRCHCHCLDEANRHYQVLRTE